MVEPFILLAFAESPLGTVIFKKPSPCYKVESYEIRDGVLNVHLSLMKEKVCPQVITEDRVILENGGRVKKVRVFVNGGLWWETSIQER
ncbi:MAG: hypothetical protein Q9N26_06915 [Aquificota bacterium]|nr:hypothetical protein [Aquificota bacterium]